MTEEQIKKQEEDEKKKSKGGSTPPPPPPTPAPSEKEKTDKEIEAEAIAEGKREISFEEFNDMIGNDGVNNHSALILREKQEEFKYNLDPKPYNEWFRIYNEVLQS